MRWRTSLLALLVCTSCGVRANRPLPGEDLRASLGPRLDDAELTWAIMEVRPEPSTEDRSAPPPASIAPTRPAAWSIPVDLRIREPLEPDAAFLAAIPLAVDFGAGEAPFDDGERPVDRDAEGPGGFSDAILQLRWQRPLTPALDLTGAAAMSRFQDLAILEGLSEAEFAWVILGVGLSF